MSDSHTVQGYVKAEGFVFDQPRDAFREAVGPECAKAGRDMYLALMAEYDRRFPFSKAVDNE